MKVRFEPFGVTTHIEAGKTLLDAAVAAGVEIESICGGRGTCAKCKVIATRGLSAPNAQELKKLSDAELRSGYRLACQAIIEDDVEVVVPEESRISRVSILQDGIKHNSQFEPWVQRHTLHVPEATLANQISDFENVRNSWRAANGTEFTPTLRALRQLPGALRARGGHITLVAVDERIVRIEAGDGPERILGIAFDIGTTTVVGYLINLETGEQIAVSSLLNPQTRYGDDVVSRIDFGQDEENLQTLQRDIVQALNKIIAETAQTASVNTQDIMAMTVVGNTTMHHLFLGISPAALARSPYVPVTIQSLCLRAEELGIGIYPDAQVCVLPNIAGWVGADTVGVILATDLHNHESIALAIDIGTNGEMALGSRERLLTCSTAAGPAFEGAHLSCGMRAADGAIDVVRIDGDVYWHTIGNSAPRGLCGSGLVDLVAAMLDQGIIDNTGMMQNGETLHANGRPKLSERIRQNGRQRDFLLVESEEGAGGRPVIVTQRDVRELQLAKGAIRAGIEILMKELGVGPKDVRRVYLAGAFGNYIKPESALRIGLIPHFPNAEIVPVGNAAGSGAKMALISRSMRRQAERVLEHVEYLELSGRPDFQDEFAQAMVF